MSYLGKLWGQLLLIWDYNVTVSILVRNGCHCNQSLCKRILRRAFAFQNCRLSVSLHFCAIVNNRSDNNGLEELTFHVELLESQVVLSLHVSDLLSDL